MAIAIGSRLAAFTAVVATLGCNALLGLDERARATDGSVATDALDDTLGSDSRATSDTDPGGPPDTTTAPTDTGVVDAPIDSTPPCPSELKICSGGKCTDVSADPLSCGACDKPCAASQYCLLGKCECRPYSRDCGGTAGCRPIGPYACSSCADACGGATYNCDVLKRVCVATCPSGLKNCASGINYACVDIARDAFNCGDCSVTCKVTQLCVGSVCRTYVPALGGCSCPSGFTCCKGLPGQPSMICVEGKDC